MTNLEKVRQRVEALHDSQTVLYVVKSEVLRIIAEVERESAEALEVECPVCGSVLTVRAEEDGKGSAVTPDAANSAPKTRSQKALDILSACSRMRLRIDDAQDNHPRDTALGYLHEEVRLIERFVNHLCGKGESRE